MLSLYRRKTREAQLFRSVFGTEDGKKVLSIMYRNCGLGQSGFDVDPHAMAYNLGMREVVLRIMEILNTDTESMYQEMDRLAKEEDKWAMGSVAMATDK